MNSEAECRSVMFLLFAALGTVLFRGLRKLVFSASVMEHRKGRDSLLESLQSALSPEPFCWSQLLLACFCLA